MSNTIVGILGLVTIIAIVVTLFRSKTQPAIAFIVWPTILALVMIVGGRFTFDNLAAMIKAGFNSTCILGPLLRHHDRCRHVRRHHRQTDDVRR